MSRYPRRPPIATFKPSHARFDSAPETPEYQALLRKQLQRFAPDKLIDLDHAEALRLNRETR